MTTVFSSAIVTVRDLVAAKAFYQGGLKLTVTSEGSILGAQVRDLWGLPSDDPVKFATLKRRATDEHGNFLLLQVPNASGRAIRAGARLNDLGVLDVGLTVRGFADKIAELGRLGYPTAVTPSRYEFKYYKDRPPFFIEDTVVVGPDETLVALMERIGAPYEYGNIDPASGYSQIIHSALIVDDIDIAIGFFDDVLGLPLKGCVHGMPHADVARILELSSDEPIDWAFLVDKEERGAFIELVAPRVHRGRQIEGQASMANYGIAALAFVTDDLAGIRERAASARVPVMCRPLTIATSPRQAWTFMTLRGPSEIICEVRQRANYV